jgi:Arc/MetJ-type ribon-helix-helix transcriptional regulator
MGSEKIVRICIRIEKEMIKEIDAFVKRGLYRSRSEFIRVSIRKKLDMDKGNKSLTIERYLMTQGGKAMPIEEAIRRSKKEWRNKS